jgi:hypothetical protein
MVQVAHVAPTISDERRRTVEAVMEASAELRWFWQGAEPAALQQWFSDAELHDCAAGGGCLRTDTYLFDPQQAELGIKLRGNKTGVEVKGLVAVTAEGCRDPLPEEGCNVEYTQISVEGSPPCVTLSFEAFGALDAVAVNLRRTTATLAMRRPPALVGGWRASYPSWLRCSAAPPPR